MTTLFQRSTPTPLMVKNLRPGVTEVGHIKIGRKGEVRTSKSGAEFQMPQKFDHFLVTTMHRGDDGNFVRDEEIHRLYGAKPRTLPVRLLFDDPLLNFQTQYVAYWGTNRWCSGDGEVAERLGEDGVYRQRECPCPNLEQGFKGEDGRGNGKCKINGTLSVIIDAAALVGGVWRFRTTSINTCESLARSLDMLYRLSSGHLAGIPLNLTVAPKQAKTPEGMATTIFVVGLTFRGTVSELRAHAEKRALEETRYVSRMAQLDEQARKALLGGPIVPDEEIRDVVEEFYPEIAANGHDDVSPPRQHEDGTPFTPIEEVDAANAEAAELARVLRAEAELAKDPLGINGSGLATAYKRLADGLASAMRAEDITDLYDAYKTRIARLPDDKREALESIVQLRLAAFERRGESEGFGDILAEEGELVEPDE